MMGGISDMYAWSQMLGVSSSGTTASVGTTSSVGTGASGAWVSTGGADGEAGAHAERINTAIINIAKTEYNFFIE